MSASHFTLKISKNTKCNNADILLVGLFEPNNFFFENVYELSYSEILTSVVKVPSATECFGYNVLVKSKIFCLLHFVSFQKFFRK